MKKIGILITLTLCTIISLNLKAQEDTSKIVPDTAYTWHHLDLEKDGVVGISLNEAIAFAESKNRKAQPVVVAVLDSGIDTAHYDLKTRLWVNPNEIPGNGIDDDNNGYIDDVHGWNFLGNADGTNVYNENWEVARLYRKYKAEFGKKTKAEIQDDEMADYKEWLKVKEEYETLKKSNKSSLKTWEILAEMYEKAERAVVKKLDEGAEFNLENVEDLEVTKGSKLASHKSICVMFLSMDMQVEDVKEMAEHYEMMVFKKLNPMYQPRKIIGDDVNNINDTIYGNNDIQGGDPSHGTHVAGIIGADATNDVGTKGICPTSELMILRVVPSGDERDKDVALAYQYAARNGAKIINCSFGKTYSPNKQMVDDIVRWVDKQDVLIVHAAGNDAVNNDKVVHYPVKNYNLKDSMAQNWITVGSTTKYNDNRMISSFSNYGREQVDLLAPGSDILSTYPTSELKPLSGTSMATPVVSGVAALVWSYYPELSVEQLKEILLLSVVDYSDKKVNKPNEKGKSKKTKVKKLCATGGVINALTAMQLADEYVNR
jgi:subtilisin family serine protease